MFADPLGLPQDHHVRVQVRDGLVILHGDTRFRGDARVIVSTVSRVRGVIDVVDRLHWREPGPKPEPIDTRR
jgi:osmotically-inducible protein OsmY